MSASSSVMSSPGSEITPRAATSVPFDLVQPTASATIDSLGIPAGKYYPSNYNSPATTRVSTPTSAAAPLLPTNLTLPSDTDKRSKRQKSSGHERNSSDVKRKLQQYQRDMIVQARQAKSRTGGKGLGFHIQMPKPDSPKLMPAGSPGPITPFELEECDEYLTSVTRGRGDTSISNDQQGEFEGRRDWTPEILELNMFPHFRKDLAGRNLSTVISPYGEISWALGEMVETLDGDSHIEISLNIDTQRHQLEYSIITQPRFPLLPIRII
ncbi:hypothetical protein LHYA1_G006523 [Lachnellula hyalina]|uniref:Uncharacterized protein n=1 Tax=Lachnellula hyalina TaxID=1316788 RepID=A0A8H8TZE2_9HELO|nr:uncharacterized protein LHYA1_G006523 [Lachnellula hyalina]TVY25732.1 hypothetical protein LHYA1_G006523 [Lachnellula hyalina]